MKSFVQSEPNSMDSPRAGRRSRVTTRPPANRPPAGILVVEDEAIVARDLEQTLETMGYQVTGSVASGDEALRAVEQRRPDLVLMDIRLRGDRDGIETAKALRARWDIPVVYMTAFSDEATLARATRTSAYGYVVKPFVSADVRCAVEIALHKHAAEQSLTTNSRLAALGTMAMGVAHEINNPLTYMMMTLERLDKLLPPQQGDEGSRVAVIRRSLAEIGEGADRIKRIVSDLSLFGRPIGERAQRVDVRDSVSWALRVTAGHTRNRTTIVTELTTVSPVEATDARLGQVLVNLILNAVQALPGNDIERREIRIRTFEVDGQVVISVSDTGRGIAPEHLSRIFDPFFTTKDVGTGMGLGLAVCHGIVTALGGALTARSTVGKGSVFEVRLPAVGRPSAFGPDRRTGEQPQVRRGRLLLVDDEPMMLNLLRASLEQEHDVVACKDAKAALAVLQQDTAFDIVISDVVMPGMTGRDLYEAVRSIDCALAGRMAFMTGGTNLLDGLSNPVIAKPFRTSEMQVWVRELLARSPLSS